MGEKEGGGKVRNHCFPLFKWPEAEPYLEGGGVVDAVAGHGHDVPPGLQGADDVEFVPWRGAVAHHHVLDDGREAVVAAAHQLLDLPPAQRPLVTAAKGIRIGRVSATGNEYIPLKECACKHLCGSYIPALRAMDVAVSCESPVIIITRAPLSWIRCTASTTPSRNGSFNPTMPHSVSCPGSAPHAMAITRSPSRAISALCWCTRSVADAVNCNASPLLPT